MEKKTKLMLFTEEFQSYGLWNTTMTLLWNFQMKLSYEWNVFMGLLYEGNSVEGLNNLSM